MSGYRIIQYELLSSGRRAKGRGHHNRLRRGEQSNPGAIRSSGLSVKQIVIYLTGSPFARPCRNQDIQELTDHTFTTFGRSYHFSNFLDF